MPEYALSADWHFDARRARLFGNKTDPDTGLSTFCLRRIEAFKEYLKLINKRTKKAIFLGDLIDAVANEQIRSMIFGIIAEHLDECWIILGNHEVGRHSHAYETVANHFKMNDVDLKIVSQPMFGSIAGHEVTLAPWKSTQFLWKKRKPEYILTHADPDELPKQKKGTKYVLGHIHDHMDCTAFLQLGPTIPVVYGEESNGLLIYLTEDGIEEEPCPLLFDIVNVESQDDIDDHDPKLVCYRVNARLEDLKFPRDAIYYRFFSKTGEKEELDVGEVSGAFDTLKSDTRSWLKREKIPKKYHKVLKRKIKRLVKEQL